GAELGIKKVRLTGGEPLVRKDVVDLVEMLNQIPKIEEITLTTNGILLAEHAQDLVGAGLARVNISLDTLDRAKFKKITRVGEQQQVLEGIKAALKVGLDPVKINVVVMKGINDDEILNFVNLTRQYPVHVRFIEFMPSGDKKLEQEKRYLAIDKVKEIITEEEELLFTNFDIGNGPANYYQVEQSLGAIGFISPISNHFCSECNRLRLTATGQLRPCLTSEQEIDLKSAVQSSSLKVLRNKFKEAAVSKPAAHSLTDKNEFQTNMSQIGG
ncbi:MAG: GTP 3',8-cyclase MoaA, partial [Bacillota bacterium]